MERKLETKDWDMRAGIGILGICAVDTMHVYRRATQKTDMSPSTFLTKLAEALIDNKFVVSSSTCRSMDSSASATSSISSVSGTSGVGLHLTPVKRWTNHTASNGTVKKRRQQVACRRCGKKTVKICSVCAADEDTADYTCAYCDSTNGRLCYKAHMQECHGTV